MAGIVERAGTNDIVTLATRVGWNTIRQGFETKLTREERTGIHDERLDRYDQRIK